MSIWRSPFFLPAGEQTVGLIILQVLTLQFHQVFTENKAFCSKLKSCDFLCLLLEIINHKIHSLSNRVRAACHPTVLSKTSPTSNKPEKILNYQSQIKSLTLSKTVDILFLAARSLFLMGGAWAPGASFLLIGRQVFLFTHSAATPRLTAITRRHWKTQQAFNKLRSVSSLDLLTLTLTSDSSQPGYDPRAGRRGRALAPLGLPLVHAGRCLHRDLMLEACKDSECEKHLHDKRRGW